MKNLKKLISVIIAVIMLVSSFATVAAADYADVESTNSYAKAIKVLSGLGIAQGDDEGNFNPQNDVKRSEMVAFVCRAMGEEDIATASASNAFTDVAANHWAAGYIAWGVNRGIINGMGDGTFAPDASVTYQDAVVMIMRALGYDRIAQRAENGGYPTGYLKLASQYGVLKDAGYDNAKAATREIIAQLIYNALTAPLVDVSYYGVSVEDDRYVIYNGKSGNDLRTLLTYSNDILKVKANVTKTPKANPDVCIDKAGNYMVELDITGAYDYTVGAVVAELGADPVKVYVGDTEAADLLGSTVEAYLAEDEDLNDWKLLAVVADGKSVVTETLEADVESYAAGIVKYFASENDKKATEIEVATTGLEVYYNGVKLTDEQLATYAIADDIGTVDVDESMEALANLLVNVADSITFMGPKNEAYNKIFITKYQYAIVDEVVAEDKYIIASDSPDLIYDLDLDAESRGNEAFIYNLYDANGAAIDFEDIAEGDVLNIIAPYGDLADASFIDVYVTNDSVEGIIGERRGSEGDYTYIIDGDEYESLASVKMGDEGIFYLTIDGKIVKKDAASTVTKNFAFLLGINASDLFGVNSYEVRLFTAEGEKDLKVASKFKTNVANVAADPENDPADYQVVADLVQYKTEANGQDVIFADGEFLDDLLTATKDAADAAAANGTLAARFFTYKVNAADELSEIRFAKAGSDLVASGLSEKEYLADFNSFDDYEVADAPIFVVPVKASGADFVIDTDKLAIASFDTIEDESTLISVTYKLADEDALAAVLSAEKVDLGIAKSPLAVVTAIGESLVNDETTTALTLLKSGKTETVVLDPDESFDEVEVGDIIQYALNAEDEVGELDIVYDFSAKDITEYAEGYTEADHDMFFIYAAVIREKDGSFRFVKEFDSASVVTYAANNAERYLLANAEGATYAVIDRSVVTTAKNPATGIKAISISGLKGTVKATEVYTAVAKVGENGRIADMIQIVETSNSNANWVIAD